MTIVLPPTTHRPDHAAAMLLIDSAEHHALISGADAAYLRAGAYAALEHGTRPTRRAERIRDYRGHALHTLAEARTGWEPDIHGTPALDGEIGQVVRYLAETTDQNAVARAWQTLCAAVDLLAGLADGSADPATHLDNAAGTSAPAMRDMLRDDADTDVELALAVLTGSVSPAWTAVA